MDLLTHVLEYARLGFRLFPVHSLHNGRCTCSRPRCEGNDLGKHPRVREWQRVATTDATQLAAWWHRWPLSNIGCATGEGSGLFILDEDTYDGGDAKALAARHGGSLPWTAKQRTGGGGYQYLFLHPGVPIKNSAGALGQGLDIRGDGGYAILPPSTHKSGNQYAWMPGSYTDHKALILRPAPEWLLRLVVAEPPQSTEYQPTTQLDGPIVLHTRNTTLFKLCCRWRGQGFELDDVLTLAHNHNQRRCDPPLDDEEVQRIAEQACKYAPNEARDHEAEADPAEVQPPTAAAEDTPTPPKKRGRKSKRDITAQEAIDAAQQELFNTDPLGWMNVQFNTRPTTVGTLDIQRVENLDPYGVGDFRLILTNSTVIKLGDADAVLKPAKVQAAIAAATRVVIPDMKQTDWRPTFARAIFRAAVHIDIGTDQGAETRAWLNAWIGLTAQEPVDPDNAYDLYRWLKGLGLQWAPPDLVCQPNPGWFWTTRQQLVLRPEALLPYLRVGVSPQLTLPHLRQRLHDIGIHPAKQWRTLRDPVGEIQHIYCWASAEQFILPTEDLERSSDEDTDDTSSVAVA